MQAAHAKARMKNEVLPALQKEFEAAYKQGQILTFNDFTQSKTAAAKNWLADLKQELSA